MLLGKEKKRREGDDRGRVSKKWRILSLSSSLILTGLEGIRITKRSSELGALKESRKFGILKSRRSMIKN